MLMQTLARSVSACLFGVSVVAAAQPHYKAEAIRFNNRGVALMGQQFTTRAETSFADAFKADPTMAQAAVNQGIALMTLQKIDEAKKALLQALALDPRNAQAWYNLGLAQHAENEMEPALASFRQAVSRSARRGFAVFPGRLLRGNEAIRQSDCGFRKGTRHQSTACFC